MPLPAVAWRYVAIRAESLEPGGCSAWPTSPCANCNARIPAEPPPVFQPTGIVAAVPASGTLATDWPASTDANEPPCVVAGGGVRGWVAPPISAMRASTDSTLINPGHRRPAGELQVPRMTEGRPSLAAPPPDPSPEGRWPSGAFGRPGLAEQAENCLRGLVGLGQHGGAGLLQDLVLGEVDHLLSHIDVTDARLGGHEVLLVRGRHRQRVLEAVLGRAERRARVRHRRDGGVDLRDVARTRRRQREERRTEVRAEADHVDRDDLAIVGADLERDGRRARQQRQPVERGGLADALDLGRELVDLGLDRRAAGVAQRAVLVLDGQLADALEHRVNGVEIALSGLDERDAVLDVALRLGEATDLRTHGLGDPEAGGVVSTTVDAVAGREALHGLGDLRRRLVEVAVGVERLHVVGDAKGHASISP